MSRRFLWMTLVALLSGCGVRRGDTILIPAEFEGWVQIHYRVSGAPELQLRGGTNLIEVPNSGIVKTSSSRSPGYGQDHYFSTDSLGGRVEIPSDGSSKSGRSVSGFLYFSSPAQVTIFFVGEPNRMSLYQQPTPEDFTEPEAK